MTHDITLFYHDTRFKSWCTLMSYFVLSPNGEESINKFLSPDPDPDSDHLRLGLSHLDIILLVENIKIIGSIVFELRAQPDRQTEMHYRPPRARVIIKE